MRVRVQVIRFLRNGDVIGINVRLNGEIWEEGTWVPSVVEMTRLVETEMDCKLQEGCKELDAMKSIISCLHFCSDLFSEF